MNKFYEGDIKEIILEKKHIFLKPDYTSNTEVDTEKHSILFEKGISINSTIADCLIFSEARGVIGVEIKTEHDNTRRLNKQLRNYSVVCDYVYVLCHDKHVEATEAILDKNKFHHVGIVAYTEFKGEAILGVYREPFKSPNKNVVMTYQMLWASEIRNLLGSFKRQVRTLEEKGLKVNSVESRSGGLHGLYVQSNASKYLRKTDMIKMIVNRLGPEEANRLLCNIFISGRMHPDRLLKFHHFKKKD